VASLKKPLMILGVFAAMWLAVRYLLSAVFPFVLGAMLAFAAEPLVQLTHRRLHLPRAAAVGIGVSAMLLLLFGMLSILGALLVKEVSRLGAVLPGIADTARQGVVLLED
jgi:predicted PurR-regulated permease PerM